MAIFRYFIIIGFLLIVPTFSFAGQTEKALDRVVGQIEESFPFVEGLVIAVKNGEIILDLKEGHPVKVGDRLHLFRYGDELTHPSTGKKMGRMETRMGEIELIGVGANFSRALSSDPSIEPVKGDGVRAKFKSVSLLIVSQGKPESGSKLEILTSRLEQTFKNNPRFEIPAFDLELWLLENEINRKDLVKANVLSQLKSKAGVDFVFFPQIQKIKGRSAFRYRLLSTDDGSEVKQARVLLGSMAKMAKAKKVREQKTQTSFASDDGNVQFVAKQTFPFEIVDFDIGDINGDGKKEAIIVDSHRVMIYQVNGNGLKRIASVASEEGVNQFLSVDVGDINSNGKDEIFITNKYLDTLGSFALELEKKKLKKKWDNVEYYFRIIRPLGGKPQLLAQGTGYLNPFEDGISIVGYQDGEYKPTSTLSTDFGRNRKVILYGLTRADINFDKNIETIMLDKDYHLRVYSPTGDLLIKSDEYYGHDPRLIDIGVVRKVSDLEVQGQPVRFRGRLLVESFGDRRFILIPKNHTFGGGLLSNMVLVNNSNLVILGIQKEGFEKVAETKKQKGYLAAFQVVSYPEKSRKDIYVATVEKGGLASKTVSSIFTYHWTL
jgi:hypothetical protein